MSSTIAYEPNGTIVITYYEAGVTINTGGLSGQGRIFVGDVEILRKGAGNANDSAIEVGDLILFYDSDNGDRKVEGEVKAVIDFDLYDAEENSYPNLKLYENIIPGA